MSNLRFRLTMAVLLSACGLPVPAQVPADAGQRDRMRAEIGASRDAAQALYQQQLQECSTRFVVASCVEAARKQRHDTLKELDRRETAIDDFEREQRAIGRREAIAKKEAEVEEREREAQERARAAEDRRAAADTSAPQPDPDARPPREAKARISPQQRAANEASARAAYALKQLQAEARRQEAARRNAEHAQKTNPAAPLPVPGEAASQPAPAAASRP